MFFADCFHFLPKIRKEITELLASIQCCSINLL